MTDETEHTPGPWQFEVNELGTVIAKDGYSIGSAFGSRAITGGDLPHEANGRLIAASPELLEACELALAAFDSSNVRIAYEYAGVVGKLRDAIAKVEGRSK